VIGDRGSGDPPADDDHLSPTGKGTIGCIRSERRRGDRVVEHPLGHGAEGYRPVTPEEVFGSSGDVHDGPRARAIGDNSTTMFDLCKSSHRRSVQRSPDRRGRDRAREHDHVDSTS
jgi:hypothetical protein